MEKYDSLIKWGDNSRNITRLNSSILIDNDQMHIHSDLHKEDFDKRVWRKKRP